MSARAFIVHSFWMGFLMALLGIAAGVLFVAPMTQPHCPTEDSCVVDYHDGKWHVKETQP